MRYDIAIGPKCLRWRMLMLSGPVELLLFADFIAFIVSSVVISIGVVFRYFVFLSIFLFFLLLLC